VIVLVDDLRSFVDGRPATVLRTSAEAVAFLEGHHDTHITELWLDHDLGGDDTIWPVVEVLERAAFEDRRPDIDVVRVHTANPGGAQRLAQVLERWGYVVRPATGSSEVGYAPPGRVPPA
jgi:hypothetical protein